MNTFRDKLLAAAARLHAGSLSDQERVDLGTLIARHATRIGHLEEVDDEATPIRNLLFSVTEWLHKGPVTDDVRIFLADSMRQYAHQAGVIEAKLDNRAEQGRLREIAVWSLGMPQVGAMQ